MKTLSVADARAQFSRLVESAATTHERFDVTRNGSRVAVVLGAEDYDSLVETLDILGDPALLADIREAQQAIVRGALSSESEIRDLLRRRLSA